jgi:PAS domain S-box-containing protein
MSQLTSEAVTLEPKGRARLWRRKSAPSNAGVPSLPALEILDALPAAVYVTDAAGRITYFNEAAAALWGRQPELHHDQWRGAWRLYRPDGTPMPYDQFPAALALKERRAIEGEDVITERADGSRVSHAVSAKPLFDASGNLSGAVTMLFETREYKTTQHVARRLASIVESSDDAIVSKDLNGIISTWNQGAERLFGYFAEEVIGQSIMILIPPDRQHEEVGILERIGRGERIEHFETMRRRKDGSLVSVSLTVSPVADETGKVIGASKIARDITEQKRREEQIDLLAREADHRTKNLLALAQATVHLTQGDTPDELKNAISGRLRALGRAHTALARSRWTGADVLDLVAEELSPYCATTDSRVQIEGPSAMLEQNAAQSMAVALHELTTNAVKYGALSVPAGQVRITWSVDPTKRLVFRWAETGGPPVGPPKRQGFGTRVVDRMIKGQLHGDVTFHWNPEGVVCEIAFDS